jgi:hypothetical protein
MQANEISVEGVGSNLVVHSVDTNEESHLNGSATQSVEIRVARSREEVEKIREIWSARSAHRDTDIDFCLEVIWARKEVLRPHVIVIFRNGEPETLLVGRLESYRMDGKIGYLRLPGISCKALAFPYNGLLGKTGQENCIEILASIKSALRDGEADLAILSNLCVGSTFQELADKAAGSTSQDLTTFPHYLMDVPGDVGDIYSALSSNHRSDLRRKAKKLVAAFQGDVKVRCYQEVGELDELLSKAENIAKNTYQRGLGVGFRDDEEMRSRLQLCANKGWLRAYVLDLGGSSSAFWIGTLYQQTFCSDYLSFDPRVGSYSPGTFLVTKALEDMCAKGVKEVDFGPGEARYKEQFGKSPIWEKSVFIFASTGKGSLLRAARAFSNWVDHILRRALDRMGLTSALKRLWRSRLTEKNDKS